jgi:MFS family permease
MLAQIPVGLLMDKYGPRLVLMLACLICAVGTLLFCQSDFTTVVIGRSLVGLGSAFAFVGFLKIVASWLPQRLYGFMVGMCMLLGMFGAVSGERILANEIINTPWQTIVQYSAYVGFALSLILWLCLRNRPQEDISNNFCTKINSKQIIANLLISLSDFRIWMLGIIGLFTFLSLAGFAEMWAVQYFEVVGFNRSEAAKISTMVFWGFGVGGPLWGIISDYFNSRYIPLAIGSLLTSVVFGLILGIPTLSLSAFKILAFLLGLISSVEILIFSATNDLSTQNDNATKTSIVNMLVMVGGIMVQPLAGKIIDLFETTSIASFQYALSPILICFISAAFLSLYMHFNDKKSFK